MPADQFGDGVISRIGVTIEYQCRYGVEYLKGCWRNLSSKRSCLTAENVFGLDRRQLMTTPDTEGGDGPQHRSSVHIKLEHQGNLRMIQHGLRTIKLYIHHASSLYY